MTRHQQARNARLARSIATQADLKLAPEGAVGWNEEGPPRLPNATTDKVMASRAKIHAAGRAKMAAKRKAVA